MSNPFRSEDESNKSGNYWVGDAPKTGKVGIKNPWGSKISRGWSGTPEVKVKAEAKTKTKAK